MRVWHFDDFFRRASCDQRAAFLSSFRAKIDDPVGALHHLQVVLDHDDRISCLDQPLKEPHEKGDIIEMQPRGRFIEDEKIPFSYFASGAVGQMPDELEPLRFAARQGVERLTEPQIAKPHFLQDEERPGERSSLTERGEKLDCLAHRQLEHFMNRAPFQLHLLHVRLEAPTFALRATDVEIAQELHLDFLETSSAATFATAAPGVERERARGQTLRHRLGQSGEEFAHPIINAEIKNRRRARRARKRRLIDHHDLADPVRAGHTFAGARFFAARYRGREADFDKAHCE